MNIDQNMLQPNQKIKIYQFEHPNFIAYNLFPISKILTQTHINLTFHFIEKVITTTKLLLILIYIPYVMQNKYKTMHSLQFFARQIFKYWYNITPQCQRRKIKGPKLLSQFWKFLRKQHQSSTCGTSHFSAIHPLFDALKGSTSSHVITEQSITMVFK